jgi:predicted enzyme related to lactoylglutathione lyase
MSGRVVHFEIPFDSSERAQAFYREAFGWELSARPDDEYVWAHTGPTEAGRPTEAGFVNGGLLRRESPTDGPIVVIEVDDVDDALARVTGLGGSVVLGRQQVGALGWTAYFKDVEGNIMGLFQRA